ncbi:hypothetical protein AGABI1DRAFT_68040 [Agaricus bisporus var. burnettii JB137-S8]|uniref:Thioredoxin domain-containing protein n=2 Tax=Agaricus bisporus var. burnettii TaxID=192524 RepID=K5W6G4_AGABU|nr:uncharacterized protein AGABI1DRAFT_68040 [Agaricus bisporus var. burnettii JB137-S8]EKM82424.1 hypothetical protein AGABI1DRAFT_68040 [Agaricus bisporus var. burnettii JB137-S8]KAF7778498.1 hypothetical protein Agabi119p4_2843 [Agaricus bisporus var. burnettii]
MTFFLRGSTTTFRTLKTSTTRSIRKSPTVSLSHRSFHSSLRISAIYSNANTETVEKVIKESQNRVVLVDFYADWCQPCRLFSPILEKVASEPNTSANGLPVDLVKVDTESEQGQQLAIKHQISSLPTVYVYKDGEAVTHFVGALPEPHLKQVLDRL